MLHFGCLHPPLSLFPHLKNGSVRPALQSSQEAYVGRAYSVPEQCLAPSGPPVNKAPPSSPLPAAASLACLFLHQQTPLRGLEPRRKGQATREKSPTVKGFAGLKGCHVLLQRTRSARLLGTHSPADCGREISKSSARTTVGWSFHPFSFFFFFICGLFLLPSTWVFSSLDVTALIKPRDQQQEADLLKENGKLKKEAGEEGGAYSPGWMEKMQS